jgi:hypothetical protein
VDTTLELEELGNMVNGEKVHNMRLKILTALSFVLALILALAACAQLPTPTLSPTASSTLPTVVKVSLVAPSNVFSGEIVPLLLNVQNVGEDPLVLWVHAWGVEFQVLHDDGMEVWSSIVGGHPLEPSRVVLQPGEVKEYERDWDQLDNLSTQQIHSRRVPPGNYLVRGIFRASMSKDAELEDEDKIEAEPKELVIAPSGLKPICTPTSWSTCPTPTPTGVRPILPPETRLPSYFERLTRTPGSTKTAQIPTPPPEGTATATPAVMPAPTPTPTPRPPSFGIQTAEELRRFIDGWWESSKLVISKDVTVLLTSAAAFIYHIPSLSVVSVFPNHETDYHKDYKTEDGTAALEAVLADDAVMQQIRAYFQEVWR